jgi:hypothetical protein
MNGHNIPSHVSCVGFREGNKELSLAFASRYVSDMKFRNRQFAPLVLLVLSGLVTFALAMGLLFASGGLEAQSPPGDGPTPGPAARNAIEAIERDKAEPDFEGNLNGFQFFDPSKSAAQVPAPCEGLKIEGEDREASDEEVAASPLDFELAYLPAAARPSFEGGNKCRDVVVAVVKNYQGSDDSQIAVMRFANTPQIVADAPQGRLESATISGRAAVIERPVVPEGRTAVYLRDELGYWIVSGVRMPESEVLKIAESVR